MKIAALTAALILTFTTTATALPFTNLDDLKKNAENSQVSYCSGQISRAGALITVSTTVREEYTVFYFNEDMTVFVAAHWAVGSVEGAPLSLTFGHVEGKKLIIDTRRPFDPIRDGLGPCPVVYPNKT